MSERTEPEKVSISIDKSEFRELIRTIQDMVKVLAAAQIKPDQGTERNARFLRVFGLSQQEIADLLGVTQPTVNEALSKGKKKQGKGKFDSGERTPG
jgi:predicted XRE-type DNA-binding protein